MIATSFEQSKKLLELGVSPDTADMWYGGWKVNGEDRYSELTFHKGCYGNDIPAWSLEALLKLIPKNSGARLLIADTLYLCDCRFHAGSWCSTPVETVFIMVVHLIEEGYIETFDRKYGSTRFN